MATYTQYSQAWLEDQSSIKIVLALAQVYNVVTGLEETLYLSNASFVLADGTTFNAVIRRDVTLSETLSQDGTGAMTFGDIELNNPNGEFDTWLDSAKYIWSNRDLKIYYADPQWTVSSVVDLAAKALLIFNGVIDDVDSRAKSTVNLKIRDKLERLNTPLTEDKLGTYGTWTSGQQNQDTVKPVVFGEVFNTTPLLLDPAKLKYMFNNGVSESLIEIRDNGMPLAAATEVSGLTVTLTTSAGTVTNAVPSNGGSGYVVNDQVYVDEARENLLPYSEDFGNAAWTKSNGFIQSNILPYSEDTTTWAKNQLYVQTNLVLNSEDFTNVSWNPQTGVTFTPNATTAPDGTQTADRIIYAGTGAADSWRIFSNVGTSANAQTYTSSIYLRADVPTTVTLYGNVVAGSSLICNLTTTWQRFTITGTGNGTSNLQLLLYTPGNSPTSFYAWGAQMVLGTVPGDYQKTTSAATAVGYLAPNNLYSAYKISAAVSGSLTHYAYQQTQSVSAGIPVTYSVYIKPLEIKSIQLRFLQSGAFALATQLIEINVETGTLASSTAGIVAYSITAANNGFYRVSITANTDSVGAIYACVFLSVPSSGNTFSGDGTSGLLAWGAQVVQGAALGSYQKTTTAVAPVGYASPTGALTASKFCENYSASVITKSVGPLTGVTSSAGTYTFSFYAKAGELSQVQANQVTTESKALTFNLLTGTTSNPFGGTTGTMTVVGNGWYRCTMTFTTTVTISLRVHLYFLQNSNGDGYSGMYIWGSQLEAGTIATDYIPTTTTSVVVPRGLTSKAVFTGNLVGTSMTVTNVLSGTLNTGMTVTGSGIPANTTIISGSGLTGTYTLSASAATANAVSMQGLNTPAVLTVSSVSGTSVTGLAVSTAGTGYTSSGTKPTGLYGIAASRTKNAVDSTTGVFLLAYQPSGTITCSIQGVKKTVDLNNNALVSNTYSNNIAKLIALITTQYGRSASRLSSGDLDLTNLTSFSSNTQTVGAVVSDTANTLLVCRALANSIGAQLFMSREGLLRLLRFGVGYIGSITQITEADILFNTLNISRRIPLKGVVKLGYAKNYTLQPGLLTSIASAHKDTMAEEWLSTTVLNTQKIQQYELSQDAQQQDTNLIATLDAQTEAQRLLDYYSAQRTVYRFTGTPRLLGLQLGQTVALVHSRFNLYNSGAGYAGQVISLTPNWTTGRVEVEVII